MWTENPDRSCNAAQESASTFHVIHPIILLQVVSGELDQSEQTMLDEDQMGKGYALLCVAYPKSDLVIETDKEEEAMSS